MKRLALFLAFLCVGIVQANAQKFGYVDTNFILNKMPEYAEAQQELQKVSQQWQQEIEQMQQDIDGMYAALQAEEVLLTPEMKAERMRTIREKEAEARAYQQKVFGYKGLYFLKKKELMKPVQDKVFEAVEVVAKKKRLQIVFDKAGDLVMIYTDPVHDYTDFVLEELDLGDENDTIK
jgi:outer membrane protein